ncbi:RluA family pseudouridine synthase [Sphingomonas sp. Leaf62]|uniref:RluA family pseudouridine synthase n=1 Tax=Sphingomonas sp. Leaf62 TaxID=1736228 RepID=UPI0006FD4906|nr:RluA family pseudouridine synthase [Sphingomonas sp. Leaf62]KQN71944.1 pseudouridine synthase [Sphingomonas sp. Leaf62]
MDRGVSTIEARITDAAHGLRIDKALAEVVPDLSRERVKALMAAGHVAGPDGLVSDGKRKVAAGQQFVITLPPAVPLDTVAQDIPLVVAYEDDHLIVVDKPAGLVVHPAAGNLDGTLVNALLHHCAGNLSGIGGVARPGIVHRIDKDTSGLLVVAKNDVAHEGLARQFKDHSIDRRYLAIAAGRVLTSAGTVDAPLARSPNDRKKMAIVRSPLAKHAVTHWRKLRQLRDASLIECRLETGRTHQVRVHMASIGHPLLGDPVYAGRRPALRAELERLDFRRQALHAAHLGFIHPVTSNALAFDSDVPADMQELLDHLHV